MFPYRTTIGKIGNISRDARDYLQTKDIGVSMRYVGCFLNWLKSVNEISENCAFSLRSGGPPVVCGRLLIG